MCSSTGFPEHIRFDEFVRRYQGLLPSSNGSSGKMDKKEEVEFVLYSQGIDKNLYRLGLSQAFFRAGTLANLDRLREDQMHGTMVRFQVSICMCVCVCVLKWYSSESGVHYLALTV